MSSVYVINDFTNPYLTREFDKSHINRLGVQFKEANVGQTGYITYLWFGKYFNFL